jgi:hypothetical protein
MALMAAVLFGGSSPAGAASDSSWLQGARLVISGGPCAGTYTLDLRQGPESVTLADQFESRYPLSGPACPQPPELVVTRKEDHLFAVAVDYRAGAPVDPVAGFVLHLPPPEVKAVHGANVPSKNPMFMMWTEPFWAKSLAELPRETQYVLWQRPLNGYGAAIPLVGGGHRSALSSEKGEVVIVASSYDSNYVPQRVPLFAWGRGQDPFRLTSELYAFALPVMGAPGKLRTEKPFPEMFNYLGWCSWNSYYRDINEDKLVAHARHYQEAGLPFRWMLIDDGWQTLDKRCPNLIPCQMHLSAFEAVPDRFPGGLKQTVAKLKSYGITWVGVWHTFNGYWNGIALNSELGREYADALLPITTPKESKEVKNYWLAPRGQAAIPDPRSEKGQRFYDAYYAFLKDSGVDFVKVDNQYALSLVLRQKGDIINIADGMAQGLRNHQEAAARYFNSAVINCMSMNIEAPYNWYLTNDARNSLDYIPLFPNNPRVHTIRNLYNALWFSELTWPDWDMFQSHDQGATMHAVGRAVSGGPVYVTDALNKEKPELIWPLVFSDGRVLRVDAPALPTRDVLFENIRTARVPLKAFARVGESGVVAAWNVNYLNLPVKGTVSPRDCEGLAGGQFAVYEHFSKKLWAMDREAKEKIKLGLFDVRLYTIVPIEDGFAAIGLVDKYISRRAISRESREPGQVEIELVEGGKFAAYAEREPREVKVKGADLAGDKISYQAQKLTLDLSGFSPGPVKVELSW